MSVLLYYLNIVLNTLQHYKRELLFQFFYLSSHKICISYLFETSFLNMVDYTTHNHGFPQKVKLSAREARTMRKAEKKADKAA